MTNKMASKRSLENSAENKNCEAKRLKLSQTIGASDRPGKILKIHLRNFMCHSSLLVDFNKNVNFIIGRNGSGKSAILTALIVVLGGRASVTNRSNSMKDFIKKGCSSTTIDIEINNVGPCAYKKDIYGNTITISRHFSSSGQSHYKIKSDSGAIVSTKRNELLKIVSCLKIMVDNPLSVLTQDTARTFLNSFDPKKSYLFFSKATSLDHIKVKIQDIVTNINKSNEKFKKMKDEQEAAKTKIEDLRKQLEKFKSIDTLKQIKSNIEIEIKWSNIIKLEEEESSVILQLKEKLNEVEEMTKQITEENNLKKNFEDKIRALENSLKDKQNETQGLMSNYQELKNKYKEQKEIYMQKSDCLKQTKGRIAKIRSTQNVIMQEIETQEKQLGMRQELKAEKEQNVKTLLSREKELKDLRTVTEMELQSYFGNNAKLQDDIEKLAQKLNQANGKISQTTSVMRMLSNESSNALSLYGAHMPQLLEIIEKAFSAGHFAELPKGPIGSYIKVNNKAWAGVIEKNLGVNFLKGFCVTNAKDKQTLVKLIKHKFPNTPLPDIITSKFIHKLHDISKTKAASDRRNGILNFFDAITVSDVVVANCIIDQHSIERLLLFDSEDVAMQCMSIEENVPRNCRMAILKDGTTYYPVPNYRMYFGENQMSHLLEINIEARQNQLKEELEGYKKDVATIEKTLTDTRQQYNVCQKEFDRLNKQIKVYDDETFQIQNKLRELKNEEETTEGNVSLLKEEYEVLTKKESEMKDSITDLEDELKSIKSCAEELTESSMKAKASIRESEEVCLGLQDKIDKLEQSRRTNMKKETLKQKVDSANKQCEEIKKQIDVIKEKLSHMKEDVDERTRPESVRSITCLNDQLHQIKSNIRSVTACALDPVKLQNDYDKKMQNYEIDASKIGFIQVALNDITKAINLRYKLFIKLRQCMTTQVQQYFAFMLQMRKYHGFININHDDQTLCIEIDTQTEKAANNSSQSTVKTKKNLRDLRTLSGGERSYSTVSFLVALWNCMNLPFYFLDEFDVFMDHMNRKIVMEVLIQNANDSPHKQYVFLTPQDTSSVTASDTLKIHKMADPKR